MIFKVETCIVICLASVSYCANILAFIPTPSYSHQVAFMPLWRELSLRGHKLTVVTSDPMKNPELVNLTEIDVHFLYDNFANISNLAEHSVTMWNMLELFRDISLNITNSIFRHLPVQNLKNSEKKFDVVLVEFLYPEYLSFAELHSCPKILISSLDAFTHIHRALGNPSNPVLNMEIGVPFYKPLTFQERLLSTIHTLYLTYYFYFKEYPLRENLLWKYVNTSLTIKELIADVDMMFLNVNPVISNIRAIGPSTINIGGFTPPIPSEPLSKDLKDFLDNAKDGFVYFCLGSNVKSSELARPTFTAIFDALTEIPYKVLWKYEDDNLPGKPDNIKPIKWSPQRQVLSHPNIKVFVTQGGLQSMGEGVYSEVPFVVIPFFADQELNAKLMAIKGTAKIVNRKPFVNKEELKDAILEVINDSRYKKSVTKLNQLAVDTPMSGLEKAVWWTEYVIKHKGAKHLRNPAADLPIYEYYLLDVIAFFVVIIVLVINVLVMLVKVLYRRRFLFYKLKDTILYGDKKIR